MNKRLLIVLVLSLLSFSLGSLAVSAACVITLSSPDTAVVWSGTHSIDWSYTGCGNNPEFNIDYSSNGGTNFNALTTNIAGSADDDGTGTYSWITNINPNIDSNNYKIKVKKGAENDVSASAFTVDNTDPSTTDDVDGNWHTSDQTITLTPSDTTSGIATTYYTTDGNDPTTSSSQGTSIIVSTDGTYTIKYFSADNAGNEETVQPAGFQAKVDKTDPVTTDDYGFDGIWNNQDASIELNALDSTSGIGTTYYCVDTDNTCDPFADTTYTTVIPISTEGTSYLRYASQDIAGNQETVSNVQVLIDKTKPAIDGEAIGDEGNNGWFISPVSVEFECIDALSDIDSCGPNVLLEDDGAGQEVTGTAVDNAGNSEDFTVSDINIDKAAPLTSIDIVEGPSYEDGDLFVTSSTLFELTAEDLISGLETLTYDIDEEETFDYEEPFNLVGDDGMYTINFASSDVAGNFFEDSASFILDNTPPSTIATLDETNGLNGWYVGIVEEPEIHLTCSDEGSGVSTLFYQWDVDEDFTDAESDSVDLEIDLPGTHSLSFYCVDNLENTEDEQTIEDIKYDDDVPFTTFEVSGEKALANVYRSDVLVDLTCNDETSGCLLDGEPETVFYSLDGSEFAEVVDTITITGEGEHTLEFYSEDVAGNQEYTQSSTYHIDALTPVLTISPTEIVTSPDESIDFIGTLMPQLLGYDITWDFGDESGDEGTEVSHSFAADGVYTVTASVTDGTDTVSETASIVVGASSYTPSDAPNVELSFTDLPPGTFTLAAEESDSTSIDFGSMDSVESFFDITSDLTNGEFEVNLVFTYADVDQDGIVDGTTIDETNLNIYYYDIASTSWVIIPDVIRNTGANTITAIVDHFTTFGLFGPVPSISGGGGGGSSGGGGGGGGSSGLPRQTIAEQFPQSAPAAIESAPEAAPVEAPVEAAPAEAPAITGEAVAPPITGFSVLGMGTKGSKLAVALVLVALGVVGFRIYRRRKNAI
ncbi:MAG TPA: PKD domain-containing protein [Candidatus Nanoarchaeia archaeon]|nr:PKD domain-containing protein [Candidatus Nanoarchaeia archaeon]